MMMIDMLKKMYSVGGMKDERKDGITEFGNYGMTELGNDGRTEWLHSSGIKNSRINEFTEIEANGIQKIIFF